MLFVRTEMYMALKRPQWFEVKGSYKTLKTTALKFVTAPCLFVKKGMIVIWYVNDLTMVCWKGIFYWWPEDEPGQEIRKGEDLGNPLHFWVMNWTDLLTELWDYDRQDLLTNSFLLLAYATLSLSVAMLI